jgi:hypothetical protein
MARSHSATNPQSRRQRCYPLRPLQARSPQAMDVGTDTMPKSEGRRIGDGRLHRGQRDGPCQATPSRGAMGNAHTTNRRVNGYDIDRRRRLLTIGQPDLGGP